VLAKSSTKTSFPENQVPDRLSLPEHPRTPAHAHKKTGQTPVFFFT
jgi:hypothetical protein